MATTKDNILAVLRRKALTVAQLCERLGVTRNAINVQIKQLQAEGLVRPTQVARRGRLGKPAVTYEAAPNSEDVASRAYPPFLGGLIAVLQQRLGPKTLVSVLEATGRQMARSAGLAKPADFDTGLRAAMAAADALGASTEAVRQKNGIMVRNYSCPVGAAVRAEPYVCRALAAFFSEATGSKVTEQCWRKDRLTCQYFIERERA